MLLSTQICAVIQNKDQTKISTLTFNPARSGQAGQPGEKHRNSSCSAPSCLDCEKFMDTGEVSACQEVLVMPLLTELAYKLY